MRWVWRAESGGFKLEYAALILVVTTVVVAVLGLGLPTQVQSLYERGLCLIAGQEGCEVGPQAAPPQPSPSEPGTSADPGKDEPTADPEGYDPEASKAYENSLIEMNTAAEEQAAAHSEYDTLGKDLLNLVSELIGLADAKKCILEGDIVACIWTAVGLMPWGKAGKIISKIPKVVRLFNRWRKLHKAKKAADRRASKAEKGLEDAGKACRVSNSFIGSTPVMLADGRQVEIKEVEPGDQVLATDPGTKETRAETVTDTLVGSGAKELVQVRILTGAGSQTLTATAGHPFWVVGEAWTVAERLDPGDILRAPDGTPMTVSSVFGYSWYATVHNLTVSDAHTYYVAAGSAGVLVHNAGGPTPPPTGCHGKFVPSPKHGKNQRGRAAPGPTNGQKALDNSVSTGKNTNRRVGVDKENGEIVIFDETHDGKGIFHGHQRPWKGLEQQHKNALIKAGLVTKKGKIK